MRSYNIHMYTDPYIIHVHTWSCLLGLKLALGLVQTILYSFPSRSLVGQMVKVLACE